MKDITNFLSKSEHKPELCHVYVHDGYAVATDSFRLIEIKLDEFCTDNVPNGYYTATKWKAMYKAYTKKSKDLVAFMVAIQENNLNSDARKDFSYPDYKAVIPAPDTLSDTMQHLSFNPQYLKDFIDATSSTVNHFYRFNFADIKTDGKMIYYSNEDTKVLLMALYK